MTVEMILRTVSPLGGGIEDSKDKGNGRGLPTVDLIELLLIYMQRMSMRYVDLSSPLTLKKIMSDLVMNAYVEVAR